MDKQTETTPPKQPKVRFRYSLEIAENVCGKIETLACSIEAAAAMCGVSRSSVYKWQKEHPEFVERLTRARDKAEAQLVVRALAGGKGSHAALWLLERRFRHDYGPTVQPQVVIDNSQNVLALLERMDTDALLALAGGTAAIETTADRPLKLVG